MATIRRTVLNEFLRRSGIMTDERLSESLGLTVQQVRSAVSAFIEQGVIERISGGVYRLVESAPTGRSGPSRASAKTSTHDGNVVGPLADDSGVVIRTADGLLRIARFE